MLESKKPSQLIKKLQSNEVELNVNFLDETSHKFSVKVSTIIFLVFLSPSRSLIPSLVLLEQNRYCVVFFLPIQNICNTVTLKFIWYILFVCFLYIFFFWLDANDFEIKQNQKSTHRHLYREFLDISTDISWSRSDAQESIF